MSVLRLLSPSRAPAGPSSLLSQGSSSKRKITIDIQLLTNGTILMEPPDDPLWPHARSAGPRDEQLLNGVLEIQVPRGSTRRRCRSVRVGVRTRVRLNMGPGRGWEEDVIFERKVEMMDGLAEGIVLDEGMQRFEFTLIIPSTFAPHDRHPTGIVNQELFAELEGQPKPSKSSSFNLFGRAKQGGSRSSSRTPSRSPSPTGSRAMSPVLAAADSLLGASQGVHGLPAVPSYDESQANPLGRGRGSISGTPAEDDWILGVHEASRNIQVTHNPNPTGNACDLDKSHHGFTEGPGVYDLKVMSDIFTVGGPVHTRLSFAAPSPGTTIFSWVLRLKQILVLTSPRDDPECAKSISETKLFDIVEFGTRPPRGMNHPGREMLALWRGREADGTDDGGLISEGNAFMTKHHEARPTTLPGLETPIHVTHALMCEVYMSVWGEDNHGRPMPKPGPGGLRILQVNLPITLPSCSLIPAILDVPNYAQITTDKPCPECGHRSNAQICLSCAPTFVPHPRHDLDESQRDEQGFCPACYKRFEPVLDPFSVEMCACRLDTSDVEARMARFWHDAAAPPPREMGRKVY